MGHYDERWPECPGMQSHGQGAQADTTEQRLRRQVRELSDDLRASELLLGEMICELPPRFHPREVVKERLRLLVCEWRRIAGLEAEQKIHHGLHDQVHRLTEEALPSRRRSGHVADCALALSVALGEAETKVAKLKAWGAKALPVMELGKVLREEAVAKVATLEAEKEDLEARHDQMYQDRFDALNARTTEGMSAAEWQLRTGKAERERGEAMERLAKILERILEHDCGCGLCVVCDIGRQLCEAAPPEEKEHSFQVIPANPDSVIEGPTDADQ